MNTLQNVLIRLTLDGTPVEGAVELPVGRAPQRVLLPALHNLTDAVVTLAHQRQENQGQPVRCRKGCDACCRQMVPLAPAEAFALGAYLDGLPPTVAAPILERFDQAVEALEEKGLLEPLRRRGRLSDARMRALDRDYFLAHIACPFLRERACLIHPVRPLACREYLVTSAPRFCALPQAGKVVPVALSAKPSQALVGSRRSRRWVPLLLAREYTARWREPYMKDPRQALLMVLKKL